MAGVSCKAGTEAIVGLSNPSYSREGFRILFPGAAASGPSPSNPAFPSPGSLWGVTFCSILASGNRRSAASSPGGLGAAHRRGQHNPGSGGKAALPGPPDGSLAAIAVPCAALRATPAAWRAPQAAAAGKWRRPLPAGDHSMQTPTVSDPRHRRQFRPLPVYRGPVFLPRPPGATSAASDLRWWRMNTERGFREPPPPSLKSSRGRSGQTPRAGRGPRKGSCGGFYGVCTARRGRPRAGAEAICRRMDADWLGSPLSSRSAGRILQPVLDAAPLQREMAPPSPAPALYI